MLACLTADKSLRWLIPDYSHTLIPPGLTAGSQSPDSSSAAVRCSWKSLHSTGLTGQQFVLLYLKYNFRLFFFFAALKVKIVQQITLQQCQYLVVVVRNTHGNFILQQLKLSNCWKKRVGNNCFINFLFNWCSEGKHQCDWFAVLRVCLVPRGAHREHPRLLGPQPGLSGVRSTALCRHAGCQKVVLGLHN